MSHSGLFILSAGTRIVTRNDANRFGGGQLIQVGEDIEITACGIDFDDWIPFII